MAVAAPVLERRAKTEEELEIREKLNTSVMTDDERHNSQISEKYAKLINPECTLSDIIVKETAIEDKPEIIQRPYLVKNARADAEIFRADSVINRRLDAPADPAEYEITSVETDEEESEDLRPTQTTIQYRTSGVKTTADEGKIVTKNAERRGLTKKDKIILATVVTIIIALFVLIIVNSAVISNIGKDISYLQSSLASAKTAYTNVSNDMQSYLDNLPQTVEDFALSNGMVLR
ncbi:MAG: hypothetical protein K2N33_05425 [Clostridia bacterium]|nr:hypothetical protein [Clostridia bacterium]